MICFTTLCTMWCTCQGVGITLLTIFVLHKIHKYYKNSQEYNHLEQLRLRKQKEREAQFESLKKQFQLTKEDETILKLKFSDLQIKLQTRDVLAQDILRACIAKSLKVQDEFNCITEFVPGAIERAKELDSLKTPKGPLHGIPFCVKDDTNVKGMDSTSGFSKLLYKPAKESAVFVQILENLGAVPFCRTNLPQGCLSIGSDNPIFGRTLNPLNKKLGPGGSSSGSACLVAAGGCPFGTGSDSGGSLRIPAQCCGISTLRATYNRLSDDGMLHCSPNLTTVPGILINKARDMRFIYEAMINYHNQHPLDCRVPQLPWNEAAIKSTKPLRIGYYTSMTSWSPIGDIEDVILQAKSHLLKLGHEVAPFVMPDYKPLWFSMTFDNTMCTSFLNSVRNDAISDCVKDLRNIFYFFPFYKKIFSVGISITRALGIKTDFGHEDPSHPELEKEAMTKEILLRMNNLDLLLCPVFPFLPVDAGQMAPISMKISMQYSMIYPYIWNLVNFPAGVVKLGEETGRNWPVNNADFTDQAKADAIGMPIGVQIVGKPYQEEQVLRILEELENINN